MAACHGAVQFGGMIGMDHHDRRQPRAAEPGDQLLGDSLGNHDRQPGMDPQPPQMRDRGQPARQFGQMRIDQCQRIAAAKNHLAQGVVGRDLFDRRLPVVGRSRPLE